VTPPIRSRVSFQRFFRAHTLIRALKVCAQGVRLPTGRGHEILYACTATPVQHRFQQVAFASLLCPCSVLSRHPCYPTFCSVFSRHGCQPDINYPIGQDLRLTITSRVVDQPDKAPDAAAPDEKTQAAPERHLDTIREMFSALRGCWIPPVEPEDRQRRCALDWEMG
jgi:hypothetical protein